MIKVREQASTLYPINFLMVDNTDHVTGLTGLTPVVTLSKNGGAFAGAAGAVSEISNGWYSLAGNAVDRNTLGELLVHAAVAGADPFDIQYAIVSYDPFVDIASILTDTETTIPATITIIDDELAVVDGNVDSILDDTGTTGVLIADDAITSAAYDEATAFPTRADDAGATQIARVGADGDTLETLSDQLDDVEPADVWSYASRTLTQSAAAVAAAVAGDSITILRGDTASIALTDIGALTNYSKIYFTVKNNEADADDISVIMIEKTDGLKYIDGAAAVTAANGSLVIDDEPTGDITITLAAVEAAKLSGGAYHWDVQILRTIGVPISTLVEGTFIISEDVTRTVT